MLTSSVMPVISDCTSVPRTVSRLIAIRSLRARSQSHTYNRGQIELASRVCISRESHDGALSRTNPADNHQEETVATRRGVKCQTASRPPHGVTRRKITFIRSDGCFCFVLFQTRGYRTPPSFLSFIQRIFCRSYFSSEDRFLQAIHDYCRQ